MNVFAKMFSTNVVDLKATIDTRKVVSRTVRLFEAEKIIRELENLDIKYEVTPDLLNNYSELAERVLLQTQKYLERIKPCD